MDLKSINIIEKDVNDDIFLTWTFPNSIIKQVIVDRSGLDNEMNINTKTNSRFSKFRNIWLYHITTLVNNPQHPKVKAISLCLCTTKFNPKKYNDLLIPLLKAYQTTFDPVVVLECYLSVVTSGKISTQYGTFDINNYDDRRAYVVPVKPIFELFGLESIMIWTAILLKKRIFVYSDRVSDLLQIVRIFPLLGAWHRMDWSIIRPITNLSEIELQDLKTTGVYVAGFNDPSSASHTDLYDLYVDISARSIRINEPAKNIFATTKFQKDLANKFLQCCNDENDQATIKFIALKTKELIQNLKKLADDDGTVNFKTLQERNLPHNMDTFLFNLAIAEKLT